MLELPVAVEGLCETTLFGTEGFAAAVEAVEAAVAGVTDPVDSLRVTVELDAGAAELAVATDAAEVELVEAARAEVPSPVTEELEAGGFRIGLVVLVER